MDGSDRSVIRCGRLSRLSLGVNGETMIELVMTECVTADSWTGSLPPKNISEAPSFESPYSLYKDHQPYHHGHLGGNGKIFGYSL